MNRLSKILAALVGMALSSCLDTREEIWVGADGSGAARINISVPAAAASIHGGEDGVKTLIGDFIAATPSVTTHLLATRVEDDMLFIDLTITFANALELVEDTSAPALGKLPAAGAELVGRSEISFEGLDVLFTRTTDLPKAIPGAAFIPRSQLVGHSVTTIIHLPKAASAHNATSTADGGRTLIWETPLAGALSAPRTTAFTMPLPIPWLFIGSLALLFLLLLAGLIHHLRRRKRAKNS